MYLLSLYLNGSGNTRTTCSRRRNQHTRWALRKIASDPVLYKSYDQWAGLVASGNAVMKEETREKRSETPPPQPPPHRQLHVPSSTTNTESTSPQTPSRRQFLTSNSIATPAVESAGIPRSVGTGEGVEEGKKPVSPASPLLGGGRGKGSAIRLAAEKLALASSPKTGQRSPLASHLAQVPRKLNFLRQKAEPPTAASSSTPDTESKKKPSGGGRR